LDFNYTVKIINKEIISILRGRGNMRSLESILRTQNELPDVMAWAVWPDRGKADREAVYNENIIVV